MYKIVTDRKNVKATVSHMLLSLHVGGAAAQRENSRMAVLSSIIHTFFICSFYNKENLAKGA